MIDIEGASYLTTRETAKRLGLSMATLRNQRSENRSPVSYIKVLNSVLYPEREVDAYARRR